jgi:arylsulfatase A-like enzyme/Tfp pilus assembly protein PilF
LARGKRKSNAQPPAPPARQPRVLQRWLLVVLALPLGAAALWWIASPRRARVRPNVLLVTIDTLRADHLGCYGDGRAATPTLDALAARGVRFATAVVHVPLTTPSHASILTGRTPLRHGVRDNGDFVLPESVPTVAEAFAKAGYRTAAFVSGFPLDRRFGLARGFETYDDHLPHGGDPRRSAYVERRADATTGAALRWLDGAAEPWFAWVHYFDPHAPYEPPAPFAERFADRPYDGEIAFVDAQLGALLRRLEPRLDHTLVVATADHGESLGEHGEESHGVFLYDATLRVPLIVAGPGLPRGRLASPVARGIDVAPTLLGRAGLPMLPGVEGRSLEPALRGEAMSDAPAYAESLYARLRLGWAPLYAWRTATLKLIEAPRPELYALDADAAERTDRAAERRETVEALRGELRAALATEPPAAAAAHSAEAAERLRALGYIGAGSASPAHPTLRDPKDGIALLLRLERAIAETRIRPAAAARELGAVLSADPGITLAKRYRALALSAAGDHKAVIQEVRELEKRGEATFDDLLLLAESERSSGRPDEAIAVLERAERLQPRSPETGLLRARCLTAAQRADDAAAEYERVLRLSPDHSEALRGLADLALARGDLASAGNDYQRILSADAGDVGALVKLAVIHVRSGHLEEAPPLFEQALARDPDNAEALLGLGGVLAKSGRPADAVPYFERAVKAGARSPVALNSLGFARLESGDAPGALSALRASLALDPRQRPVADAVAQLERGRRP